MESALEGWTDFHVAVAGAGAALAGAGYVWIAAGSVLVIIGSVLFSWIALVEIRR